MSTTTDAPEAAPPLKLRISDTDAAAVRIVARSLVREFQSRGYGARHLVSLATELIGLACDAIRNRHDSVDPAQAALEPAMAIAVAAKRAA
jgi:hypothetical protein